MNNFNFQYNNEKLGHIWINSVRQFYLNKGITLLDFSSGDARMIKNLKISQQEINAEVKGKDFALYKVKITFKKIAENTEKQLKTILSSHPSIAMDINLGYFSEQFMNLLKSEDLNFFSQNIDEIKTSCNCGEKIFCQHLSSVYKAVEKEINKNPFLILNLKRFSTAELIEATGFKNDYINKLNQNIHNKFISTSEFIFTPEKENSSFKNFSDFSFPKTDIQSMFFMLPNDPLFFEKKDFKSKLLNIYDTVDADLDNILIAERIPPTRAAEFYLYFSEDNTLKAFVTPEISFMYYLKSKGSRARYSSKTLTIPIFDEDTQKISLQEKNGVSVLADIVFEYFLFLSLVDDNTQITPSSHFLKETASLSIALVKSLSFIPEIVMDNSVNFSLRYTPVLDKINIDEFLGYYKSIMPVNFIFKEKGNKILAREASYDFLSMFLTHIIHKVIFLRASKLKNDGFNDIFSKTRSYNAITPEGKNIALSLSYWLDIISGKNKNFRPVIRIENIDNIKNFGIYIDIINTQNNYLTPFCDLFKNDGQICSSSAETEKVKSDIMWQIMIASNYMPLLKDILDSKGLITPVVDLKEILEIISKTSVFLNALEIKVVIPKELKKLISPRILLKARFKNPKNFDISSLFEEKIESKLSFKELLNFSYEIAIGDEKISREEFLELAKTADGIIKYKENYILLKPDEINSILEKLNKPPPEFSNSMELLHSTFSGFYNNIDFDADDAFKRAVDDFLKIEEITVPEGLNGTLRPYQERGFKWLYSNTLRGFGSCMADDMGLGKTIQVISLLLKLKEEKKSHKPALVVCPTTLVGNWRKECDKFSPSLKVFIYHGLDRHMDFENSDIVITTYGLLRNDIEKFKEKEWDFVIIDEAQNIKNPDAAQTVAVKSIQTKTYIAMTGTPVENRLSEFWSIFDFINKGYLGNLRNFQQNYAMPIEKFKDEEKVEKLKLATSPFTLRRLKSDKTIINDLPEKIVFDEYCYLTKEQAALYEKTLENSFKTLASQTGIARRGHIFKLITSLKQICNHPTHYTKIDKPLKTLSGKTEKTFSIIEQIQEQNEKAIIFTQYKEMGDLLVRMIKDEFKINVPFFHGSVPRKARDEMVEAFQTKDDIKLMIISLKAGGTGLNLTAATNVIHYDLWWNPAVEDQATDRTYRIGQTQNVIVHRLITLETFEEKIDEMIKSKKELADLTLSSNEKLITELSNQELKEIFSLTKNKIAY